MTDSEKQILINSGLETLDNARIWYLHHGDLENAQKMTFKKVLFLKEIGKVETA